MHKTNVGFVINGTTSSILMSAFVSHWFVLSCQNITTSGEHGKTQLACLADVVNLLLQWAHNPSACILSCNKFIAVWLEYMINNIDSCVFFLLNTIACLNRAEYQAHKLKWETSHYGEYKHPSLLLFHISDKDHREGERVDSSTASFFFLPHTPPFSN